jgi:ABC-type sugar transport system ATPase subunit
MIRLEKITKTFPGVRALDEVSFVVHPGEVHCLCGENGAGKSTLMKVLAGVWHYPSYQGRILSGDETAEVELRFRNVKDASRAGIAIVHQELALFPEMSVIDNIFLAGDISRFDVLEKKKRCEAARRHFESLDLDLNLDAKVGDLSVGQKQRLEIARALLAKPAVLVLDEPTSALPEQDAGNLLKWIRKLADDGTACIYISHRMEEVFRIADRITVLRDGRTVWTKKADVIAQADVIEAMVGRPATDIYDHTPLPAGESILEVKDLEVIKNRRTILKVDDINVNKGEIVGIMGLMGSGRSCLLSAVMGSLNNVKVTGRFRGPLDDKDRLRNMPSHPGRAMKSGIFLIPEDRKLQALFLDENLVVNITNATLPRYKMMGYIDVLSMVNSSREKMERFSVKAPGERTVVKTLSGGNQQKVLFCRAADVAPQLLLLDEPTRGIDVGTKEAIYRQMESWTEMGWSILWSSSELQELLGISDRIYVLANGRITAEFTNRPFEETEIMAMAARA